MRESFGRRRALVSGILVMMLAAFASAAGLAPGTAKGTLVIDGKPSELQFAYAMTQPNVFEKTRMDTAILVTSLPLGDGALKDLDDLEDALRMVPNGVLFKLDDKGEATREVIKHSTLQGNLQMSGMTHAKFTKATQTKDRISGSFATSGEDTVLDHKYQLQVQFDAPIVMAKLDDPLPNAKTGQKLPMDGGEPGKAYFAWEKAIQNKDVAAMKKFKPLDAPDMPDAELKEAAEMLAAMSPSNQKIVDGYIQGDSAVLYVTGDDAGTKMYGTIPMKKTGGIWRAVKPSWSNTPPK
jgi:hypothetical protein